ncbi:MAG TPA: bifunctional DNA-formamidopyrimidine glycosylase/DNA-(apurinic or apyrimidinic site) lyase [Candidatus Acidoferrales bacterium]|nr:bifunctional DNA-formamidopyrimidine glycosylase/DNA-(apurinic or apyrimidinic site) lyase [Candidatus Acidoferrales bacterium]
MPELPEVETVRRMLAAQVPGRTIALASASRHRLRTARLAPLARRLRGRTFAMPRRTGKFLLLDLDADLTLLSHLGMSGRWLFWPAEAEPDASLPHVHLQLSFEDGSRLWFQDVRRFGMLRLVPTGRLARDPSLRRLGPDPLVSPPTAGSLHALARGTRTSVKTFLLDQRKLAGLGNIYASEILFLARIDPRRRSGALARAEWGRIAAQVPRVLEASIARMGTTFSSYRTIWNEPGQYGERLLVYDRAGEPCRRCGGPVRRIVQTGRSTFFCPACQRRAANSLAGR